MWNHFVKKIFYLGSPVPPAHLDEHRRGLLDPDEADPLELHHLTDVEGDNRLERNKRENISFLVLAG